MTKINLLSSDKYVYLKKNMLKIDDRFADVTVKS